MNTQHSEPRAPKWPRRTALVVFVLLCGALVAQVSLTMHPRFLTMGDSIGSQRAIFERTPAEFGGQIDDIPNWRNRVMLPYLLEGVTRVTGMPYGRAYLLLRWVTASAAIAAFMWLAARALALDVVAAGAAAALLALSLIPTFLHIYEVPSDFLDAAFFSVLTALALSRSRVAFFLVLVLALLNRESAVFSIIVWFALHAFGGWRRFWRETGWCALCGVVSTAVVVGVRLLNSDQGDAKLRQGFQTFDPSSFWATNLRFLREFLARPKFGHPYFFLAAYCVFGALLLAAEWRTIGAHARRLVIAAVAIFALSIISNDLDELRMFIPSLVLLTLVFAGIVWRRTVGGVALGTAAAS